MDTREDHGSYYPGGEKVIPIREVSGNVKKVNGIAPDAAGNVQVPTDDTDAVRFTAQSLTDAQKAQARSNIGAIESAPVASVNGQTGAVALNGDNINYADGTTLNSQIDTIGGMAADAGTAAESAAGEIDAHSRDTSNPHNVTAAQVGALTAADVDTSLNASSTNPLANSAVAASLPYALVTQTSAEFTATDRAVNVVDGTGAATITINAPSAVSNKARDFVVTITNATADATISFDGELVVFDSAATTLEEGINILSFTEVSAGVFLLARKAAA